MKNCDQIFSELLESIARSGFITVVFMLALVIIISVIELKIERFKHKLYEEHKRKEQDKYSKKQHIPWEDSVFFELMKQNYEKRFGKK